MLSASVTDMPCRRELPESMYSTSSIRTKVANSAGLSGVEVLLSDVLLPAHVPSACGMHEGDAQKQREHQSANA